MEYEFWREVLRFLEDLAPSVIPLVSVWLGWQLSTQSQRRQRRLDSLSGAFAALREILHVVENIPANLSAEELQNRLGDDNFRQNLSDRLVRLFGLRTELIPSLDNEFIALIDRDLRPLYVIETGTYKLRQECIVQFAVTLAKLRDLSNRVERRLVAEYEKLQK